MKAKKLSEGIKASWIGFAVNSLLSIIKITTGVIGKSSAMVADGVHSLSDSATDIGVIFGLNLSRKPRDQGHDYGHGKFETVTSAIIALILIAVAAGIGWGAISKILIIVAGGQIERPGIIAFYPTILSIIANEAIFHISMEAFKKTKQNVLKANAWHHRSDSLTSVGTMIGIGGAVFLGHKWVILDPIAGVIVSVVIVKIAFKILKESMYELTEGSLDKETENEIGKIVNKTKGVRGHHDLRTRKIGHKTAIEMHILVDKNLNVVKSHDIATDVENNIKKSFGRDCFISVHVEPYMKK